MCPTASNAVRTTSYGPDGHAARDHDEVGLGEPAAQPRLDVLEPVRGDPEIQRLRPRVAHERPQPRPVRVGDARGAEVACPARGPRRPSPAPPRSGRRRTVTCATPAPAARATTAGVTRSPDAATCVPARTSPPIVADGVARVDALRGRGIAAGQRPRAFATARSGAPGLVERRRELDRHDGVGARRAAARRSRSGSRSRGGPARRARAPARDLADDRQADRRALGRAGHVRGADRVAVHRRVVPRRQRHAPRQRGGEHPAEGRLGRDRLESPRAARRPRAPSPGPPRPGAAPPLIGRPRRAASAAARARTASDTLSRVRIPARRPSTATASPRARRCSSRRAPPTAGRRARGPAPAAGTAITSAARVVPNRRRPSRWSRRRPMIPRTWSSSTTGIAGTPSGPS